METKRDNYNTTCELQNSFSDTNKIKFIDRKKSEPLFQKYYELYSKYFIAKNYKEEKILFRILYDKIYRPELYNFVLKGGTKNINLARNIFTANEEKYEYKLLLTNENFNFDDDELYSENNYLLNLHKKYLIHKFTIYSSVPIGISSLFFKFFKKSDNIFYFTLALAGIVFVVNWSNFTKKEKIYKSELQKILIKANERSIETYKNFYYDL